MKKQLLLLVMMLLPMIAHADKSGTCGDNLTWTLDESTGTLTIEGSGAMKDYSSYSSVPWYRDITKISTVVIGDCVTNIGNYAFWGCYSLTTISIPNSVTSIGSSAFSDCYKLTSITIPNSVTSIGEYAFFGCSKLTSVTIPNSVTSIGDGAFNRCDKLSNINIPVIDFATFCNDERVKFILDVINVINTSPKISLINSEGKEIQEYVIPDGVTSIGEYAFSNCSGLTSITIPNSVTSIGNSAFYKCSGLNKLIVSDIVAWCGIKFGTSEANPLTNAKHLYSDENTEIKDLVIPNGVTSIGNEAFYGCSGLKSVTIGNSVTSIGSQAFSSCTGLTSVTIGNGVTKFGERTFSSCTSLTSVTIENGVTNIGESTFLGCTNLTSIKIPNSVTSIGNEAFHGCSGLKSVTIGNGVTSIGSYAFGSCKGLTSIEIPNSVTSIGRESFRYCEYLTSVTLSKNLNSIGKEAFYNCGRLSTINCLNPIPPSTNGDTFICSTVNNNNVRDKNDIYNYAILYVPKGSKEAYSAAAEWRYFKNIKEIGEGDSEQVSYVNLTIQLGTTGFTRQSVKTLESYTFYIGSYGDNRVNAVTFNGEDVTNRLNNGYYTTPEIIGASILSVTYETTASAIQAMKQSNLKVMGYHGEINVSDIESASDVTVYTVDGKLVDSIPSAIGSVRLQVPSNQLYIVKVANRTFKLAM